MDPFQEFSYFFSKGFKLLHSIEKVVQCDHFKGLRRLPTRNRPAHVRVIITHLIVLNAPVSLCENLFVNHFYGVVALLDHDRGNLQKLLWLEADSLLQVTATVSTKEVSLIFVYQV